MDLVHQRIATTRADTNTSLEAERAHPETEAAEAQRVTDDLIERDRILVDERLRKVRLEADATVASDSLQSTPTQGARLVHPRVEETKQRERKLTDAILEHERQRTDEAVQIERDARKANATGAAKRRQDTDESLSTERVAVDSAVSDLGDTRSALSRAQETGIRQGNILAMVAHDLRNPLAILSMNAFFVAEHAKEGTLREPAEEMVRAASRMTRLLSDLLDVAYIDAGLLRIQTRTYDVSAVLKEVRAAYEQPFAKRGLVFTTDLPSASIVANFDHERIVQVLSNLLSNAMKFTPRGGTVHLLTALQTDAVEFVVRDTGPGIAKSSLPNVFERFWQVDKDARRGLGLGLYISKMIVEGHGGRMWVESELGHGATFRFTLPLANISRPCPTVVSDSRWAQAPPEVNSSSAPTG